MPPGGTLVPCPGRPWVVDVHAVITAFGVLEFVGERQPIGVSELARSLGLPKSTAQRTLKTLEAAGWIRLRSTEDARWILTPKVLSLGARVGDAEALRAVAAEPMRVLGQATGETVHLVVPDGAEVVLLAKVPSVHALQPVSFVGARSPIHATSSGKAMLAAMPDGERRSLLAGPLAALTSRTIVDPATLDRQLARVRRLGYAVNREEYRSGISSVGAAVVAHDRPVGAVTVSMPSTRLENRLVKHYGALLCDASSRDRARPALGDPTPLTLRRRGTPGSRLARNAACPSR